MPIYVYKCKPECSTEEKEVLQKLSDPAPKCEKCGSDLQKQLTAGIFDLRGHNQGYYKGGIS